MGPESALALPHRAGRPLLDELPGIVGRSGATRMLAGLNLALRLCVELAAYALLGYWGASLPGPVMVDALSAVAVPMAAMLLWIRYLAPKAKRPLRDPGALAAELSIFAGAAVAFASSGPVAIAVAFAAVAAVNTLLVRILGQHPIGPAS